MRVEWVYLFIKENALPAYMGNDDARYMIWNDLNAKSCISYWDKGSYDTLGELRRNFCPITTKTWIIKQL